MSKIEMILPTLAQAGMETMVVRLAIRLAAGGHDVGVTCLEGGGPLAELLADHGVSFNIVTAPGISANAYAPHLERWLARRKPDVLHSHSGVWLKAARAARRVGVPSCVHTLHGLLDREPWYSTSLLRLASRYTDVVTAVSRPLVEYVMTRTTRGRDTTLLVPNGVDADRFRPRLARAGRAFPPCSRLPREWSECVVLGHVARLVPIKNQRLLLNAFYLVSLHVPEARLAIIGDGPLRHELETQSRELGLAQKVLFVGSVSDVAPWLQELDLFVLSSKAEGTSMSILEALATGLCVVATDVGGNADLLQYGEAGVLVPSDSADDLASSLLRIIGNAEQRHALGTAGRRRVEEYYSEKAMIAAYETIYCRLAEAACARRFP